MEGDSQQDDDDERHECRAEEEHGRVVGRSPEADVQHAREALQRAATGRRRDPAKNGISAGSNQGKDFGDIKLKSSAVTGQ